MKEKIGILTYHRSINYGAVMQAYSLSKRLAKDFPDYDVEIIDYVSARTYLLYKKTLQNCIHAVFAANGFRQRLSYCKLTLHFIKGKLTGKKDNSLTGLFEKQMESFPLSDELIITDNVDKVFNKIRRKYKAVIVGSDAVFNWGIRRFPNPYFLHDDIGAYKLSYAASSYGQDYLAVTEEQKRYISEAWKTFDYIGVRDVPTEDFVKFADNDLVPNHNCDPTVVLDVEDIPVNDDEIKEMLIAKGIDLSKPIIGLMALDWLGEIVRSIVGDKYQIVSVYKDNSYADCFLDNLSPFQWAKVFSYFDVTFTHFFHGNLLSLKNGTPTIVIEKKNSYNQKYNSKIRDFMARVDLSDFCYYSDEIEDKKAELAAAVEDRMNRRKYYSDKISDGIEKESKAYESFNAALKELLQ
ncbi:MAG: polysaccharide pyruvyl transferase family protein [Clostridia bacterium]|nr:polysaccharide pyruvyl transferase family protein [Clostridia bacterium]